MASRWPDDIVLSVKCIPDCVPKASRESGIYLWVGVNAWSLGVVLGCRIGVDS